MSEIDLQLDKQSSLEAEQFVIGGLLLDNRCFDIVAERLISADFYHKEHQFIFETISALEAEKKPFDVLTVKENLKDRNRLDLVGGEDYLEELEIKTPSVANIAACADIVKEKSIKRQISDIGVYILQSEHLSATEKLEKIQKKIFEISIKSKIKKAVVIGKTAKDIYDKSCDGNKEIGLKTGFKDFDELTTGLHPKSLIIIGARPSMGKTSLAMNIAEHVASKQNKNVLVFSLEMSEEQIATRLYSSLTRISYKDVHTVCMNDMNEQDQKKIGKALVDLQKYNIYVDDESTLSTSYLRTKARREFIEHGSIDLIIVDYLQKLYEPSIKNNKTQEVTAIVTGLKALAKELKIPVIALSQLNRGLENRAEKRPTLADLRESGGIEQEADIVAFIYRDEFYNPETVDKGIAELIVAKNRSGACGTVKLKFFGEYTRFENLCYQPGG